MKKSSLALAFASSAVAMVAFSGTATAATTVITCGPYYNITTSGARATVRECHDGNNVRVNGSVTDLDADGQCGQVYATYNNFVNVTDYSPRACPKGQTDTFTFPWRAATDAYIYLREI